MGDLLRVRDKIVAELEGQHRNSVHELTLHNSSVKQTRNRLSSIEDNLKKLERLQSLSDSICYDDDLEVDDMDQIESSLRDLQKCTDEAKQRFEHFKYPKLRTKFDIPDNDILQINEASKHIQYKIELEDEFISDNEDQEALCRGVYDGTRLMWFQYLTKTLRILDIEQSKMIVQEVVSDNEIPLGSKSVVTSDGRLFLTGGVDHTDRYLNTLMEYNFQTNRLEYCHPMKHPRALHTAIFAPDKCIYVIGGRFREENVGRDIAYCEKYNLLTEKWETIENLPRGLHATSAAIYQSKNCLPNAFLIHCFNGSAGKNVFVYNNNFSKDLPAYEWSKLNVRVPEKLSNTCSLAFQCSDYEIVVCGGHNSGISYAYNVLTRKFKSVSTTMPQSVDFQCYSQSRYTSGLVHHERRFYVQGQNKVLRYHHGSRTWKEISLEKPFSEEEEGEETKNDISYATFSTSNAPTAKLSDFQDFEGGKHVGESEKRSIGHMMSGTGESVGRYTAGANDVSAS